MRVGLDRADFLDGELVAHPVKVILDAALHRLIQSVVGIDIDGVAIPGYPKNQQGSHCLG